MGTGEDDVSGPSDGWADEQPILEHQPQRPGWTCNGCGSAWPCAVYRRHAMRDMSPTLLIIMMSGMMTQAAAELPRPVPKELWERFMAWTR